jgi:hypothetical protein
VHFSEEFHIKTDKGNKKTIYIQWNIGYTSSWNRGSL